MQRPEAEKNVRKKAADVASIQKVKSTVQADAREAGQAHNRLTRSLNPHPQSVMSEERMS